jgi:hypothetical protein
MKNVLKAIRDSLSADNELTSKVSSSNIATTYNAKTANYPCIILSVISTDSISASSNNVQIKIRVYSDQNRYETHEIYDLIRGILNWHGPDVSNNDIKVHAIYETSVTDDKYKSNVWYLEAIYTVLYSSASSLMVIASDGKIYADESSVTASASKEIASFNGVLSLNIDFVADYSIEQERFRKSSYYSKGMAVISIQKVVFKPSVMSLWNISYNVSDKLADGSTDSTSYTVTQSTTPLELQFLFQCTKTDDGKILEIMSGKAVCEQMIIPVSKQDFMIMNCHWVCLGDSNSDVVKISVEN